MEASRPLLVSESPEPVHFDVFKQTKYNYGIFYVTALLDLMSGNFIKGKRSGAVR
jgi:hypothetical protein